MQVTRTYNRDDDEPTCRISETQYVTAKVYICEKTMTVYFLKSTVVSEQYSAPLSRTSTLDVLDMLKRVFFKAYVVKDFSTESFYRDSNSVFASLVRSGWFVLIQRFPEQVVDHILCNCIGDSFGANVTFAFDDHFGSSATRRTRSNSLDSTVNHTDKALAFYHDYFEELGSFTTDNSPDPCQRISEVIIDGYELMMMHYNVTARDAICRAITWPTVI